MLNKDALLFVQLLFPLSDLKHSGIPNNPCQDYYEDVAKCTGVYATRKSAHGLRKHVFRNTTAEEHVNWDGIVTRNNNKNMANCWNEEKENAYDPVIASTMSYSRWLHMKRHLQVCNPFHEKEKHEPGYEPTQKY